MIGRSRLASTLDEKKKTKQKEKITPGAVSQAALYVFLLFQLGSAAAPGSAGRSGGERESWGDFCACGERGSSSGGGLSGWKGLL